jgi:glycosyltransferase involved in cell wall biosynthesis
VSFLVPALNEEHNLPTLFERLLAIEDGLGVPCEIVVVDDASDDRTLETAREAAKRHPQIRPIHKPLPHGIGLGVRAGLAAARGKVGIVVMADGVDPLEDAVPQFTRKVLDEGCQLVLLSRYTAPGDAKSIPMSYKIFHVLFRFVTTKLLGIPYADTTYAFRAFDVDWLRSLPLDAEGFEISPEITFRTHFAGGRIGTVPGRQTRRVRGQSKFRFGRVAPGYTRMLLLALRMRLLPGRAAGVAGAADRRSR